MRAKNLAVESAVAPRILEQGLTSTELKKFAGTFFVVVSPSDFEPKRAAGQIRAMLLMAGWARPKASIGAQQYSFFDGIVVHTIGARTNAADALVSILNKNNIVARTGYPMTRIGSDGRPDVQSLSDLSKLPILVIEVGPKPLPESMQLKPEDVPSDPHGNKFWGNIVEP